MIQDNVIPDLSASACYATNLPIPSAAFNNLDIALPCSEKFLDHIRNAGCRDRHSYSRQLVETILKRGNICSTDVLVSRVEATLKPLLNKGEAALDDVTVVIAYVLGYSPYMPFAARVISPFLSQLKADQAGVVKLSFASMSLQNDLISLLYKLPVEHGISAPDLADYYKGLGVEDARMLLEVMFCRAFPSWNQSDTTSDSKSLQESDGGDIGSPGCVATAQVESCEPLPVKPLQWSPQCIEKAIAGDETRAHQFSILSEKCAEEGLTPAAQWVVLLGYLNVARLYTVADPIFRTSILDADADYPPLLAKLVSAVDVACEMSIALRVHGIKIIEEHSLGRGNIMGAISAGLPPDSDFSSAIEGNRCIVDRSFFIPYILSVRRVFILRPRRFGKSLWLRLLERFFRDPWSMVGFKIHGIAFKVGGLVHSPMKRSIWGPDNFLPRPVLFFDFSCGAGVTCAGLIQFLEGTLQTIAREYHFQWLEEDEGKDWIHRLKSLVRGLRRVQNQKVVVLVDEYDHCLLNCSGEGEREKAREVLKSFFSTLKGLSSEILLTVVTGISRWSLATMYSGANDLVDLTYDPNVAGLFGFTEDEASAIIKASNVVKEDDVRIVKAKCNGYCFDPRVSPAGGRVKVYNPYYISQLIARPESDDYWQNSAPSVATRHACTLGGACLPTEVTMAQLESGTPELLEQWSLASTLAYAGYASIEDVVFRGKDMDKTKYIKLRAPNPGMEIAFNKLALKNFCYRHRSTADKAADCLLARPPRWEELGQRLNCFFLALSHETRAGGQTRTEAWVHELLQTLLFNAGRLAIFSQLSNALGRPDLTIFAKPSVCSVFPADFPDLDDGFAFLRLDAAPMMLQSSRVVLELKLASLDVSSSSSVISSKRLRDSITAAACAGMAQARARCYKHDSLDECNSGVTYTSYAAVVVCDSANSRVHCLLLEDGTEIRYSKFCDNDRSSDCTLRPPSNEFYMQSLLRLVGYDRRNPRETTPLGEQIADAFDAEGMNALSLIAVEKTHLEFVLNRLTFNEHTSVIEDIDRVRPTVKSVVASRRLTSSSDFCSLFNDFIWIPEELEFAKRAVSDPEFRPLLPGAPRKRKNTTDENEANSFPLAGTVLAVVAVKRIIQYCNAQSG